MRWLPACVFLLFACSASAAEPGPQDLLAAQAPEDVAQLATTFDRTRQAASMMQQQARTSGATQLAMIRKSADDADDIWLLYRVGDKPFITRTEVRQGRIEFGWVYEAAPAQWDALFEKLRGYRQQPPTPQETGLKLRNGWRWPRGYIGAVDVYNDSEARAYLLATSDLYKLVIQGPVDALLCSTVFSGMHCRMGDTVVDGWLLQDVIALGRDSRSTGQRFLPKP